ARSARKRSTRMKPVTKPEGVVCASKQPSSTAGLQARRLAFYLYHSPYFWSYLWIFVFWVCSINMPYQFCPRCQQPDGLPVGCAHVTWHVFDIKYTLKLSVALTSVWMQPVLRRRILLRVRMC